MGLCEAFLVIAQFGAEWVLWLLVVLNTASLAIICERGWFFWRRRVDGDELGKQIFYLFRPGNLAKARAILSQQRSVECGIIAAGLVKLEFGPQAAAEAMHSARLRERIRMECNLGRLGAIAGSAPLIGLFGTVLGAVGLFDSLTELPADQSNISGLLLSGLAQALVTTGVGFFVAIPAAAALRLFDRRVDSSLAQIDSLIHLVLSQIPIFSQERKELIEPTPKAA
jgi:biopolymer transport protein ExbB/TolQ